MKNKFQNALIFKVLMHVLPWLTLYITPILIYGTNIDIELPRQRYLYHINLFLIISFFYLNKYVFIPKFLSHQKFMHYSAILLISIGVGYLFSKIAYDLILELVYKNLSTPLTGKKFLIDCETLNKLPYGSKVQLLKQYYNSIKIDPSPNILRTIIVVVFSFAISTSLTITKKWYLNELQKKEMAKEQFETELMFLKSQVNPHFLFNTLNGIYSLANKKSDKTPDAIVKLSSLIRYMLYDSNKDFVDLDEELEYIHNFIDLQSIRMHDNVKINFEVIGETQAKLIAPMLLVPFIENAFKHGIDTTQQSLIDIKIVAEASELKLKVVNSINIHDLGGTEKKSGLGLKNVKRRLELIYPNKHLLNISRSGNEYAVILTLILDNNVVLNS